MAPRKKNDDSDKTWTPNASKSKPSKSTKAAKPAKVEKIKAIAAPKSIFTDEDWRTVAALFRLGDWKPLNPKIPQKLGITKNAWHLRMLRLRNRLNEIGLELVEDEHSDDGKKKGPKTPTDDESAV